MNENNRRGGRVFVTAEPRKDTGMEIHQLHQLIAINSTRCGCFFFRAKHTENDTESLKLRAPVQQNIYIAAAARTRSLRALLRCGKYSKSYIMHVKQV